MNIIKKLVVCLAALFALSSWALAQDPSCNKMRGGFHVGGPIISRACFYSPTGQVANCWTRNCYGLPDNSCGYNQIQVCDGNVYSDAYVDQCTPFDGSTIFYCPADYYPMTAYGACHCEQNSYWLPGVEPYQCDPLWDFSCGPLELPSPHSGTMCTDPFSHFQIPCSSLDPSTPIVIDTAGKGYHFLDPGHGVFFPIDGTNNMRTSWPDPAYGNGWLVLDRNHNGIIDSGAEMLGSAFPQDPRIPAKLRNGFLALAGLDNPKNGGNGDLWVDKKDKYFSSLRVWIDANGDGKTQPGELHTLDEFNIARISVLYVPTPLKDQYGNQFRYLGAIIKTTGERLDRVYDVIPVRLDH